MRHPPPLPPWLPAWMGSQGIALWGVAGLEGLGAPTDEEGRPFPRAIAWGVPMNPEIMARISRGPDRPYADEYVRVNRRLDEAAGWLAEEVRCRGGRARVLLASERSDPAGVRGDFPHKTAATRAGLGWIGRNAQLVTRAFGPWLRLGTVFTDLELPCGAPVESDRCGTCRLCVEACPAGALTGSGWRVGLSREALLDVHACDAWKHEHYAQYNHGHNCGICAAVCPYGRQQLRGPATGRGPGA